MGVHVPHIHAAHKHRAGGHVPEPGDQAGGGGFAAAGGAHQGHGLSRLYCKRHMAESGRLCPVVGEAHVPELYPAALRRPGALWCFQLRGLHDHADAAQGGAGQHDAGGGEHDPGQRRGDDGGEHRVKGEVCHEPGKAPGGQGSRGQEQGRRNQEHEGPLGDAQVDGLGRPAHVRLIVLGLGAVLLDGLLERLEGIHRLLEDLHHRDAPDILGARLGHAVLGRLVLRHDLGVLAPHHGEHGEDGDHRRQQAGAAHPPVKDEHQHQHGNKQGDGTHDVCQIVGQQGLGVGRRRVQPSPDEAGGVGVEPAQRGVHHMGHALLADVGRRAESRQVSTHQPPEVQHDAPEGSPEGQPPVPGDALGLRPVWSNFDQIPGRQPDADVRRHAQHHGHCRQPQAQKGQPPAAPRIVQQGGYIVLLLLLHGKTSF